MEAEDDKNLFLAKKADDSISKVNKLVAELMDVSKIQNGKLNLNITDFDFNEMISGAIDEVQFSSPSHSFILSGKIDQTITADMQRLQQVLINLLTNAVKYSPRADKVFVNVIQIMNGIRVSVADSGIGIQKENLHKVFERYFREESTAVHFQGLGIGLSICYEIIQRHKGNIWAESQLGQGSTFYFTIPLQF